MTKMMAVLKREYMQAVKKKSFIIITLSMPILMAALMLVPMLLVSSGLEEKNVVIVDGTGRLGDQVRDESPEEKSTDLEKTEKKTRISESELKMRTTWIDASPDALAASGKSLNEFVEAYKDELVAEADKDDKRIDGVLLIPADVFESGESEMVYTSRSKSDMAARELAREINDDIRRIRMSEEGLDSAKMDAILRRVPVSLTQKRKSGEEKSGGELDFLISFVFVALLLIPSLIYGLEVLRGIVQEKTDRVVEVLISSMTPMQLLSGKILGLALVGLTQLAAWLSMAGVFVLYSGSVAMAADIDISQFVRPEIGVYFALFFVLAYLTYVCFYAIGGAVCNSEKEAQQFITPIVMVLMLPWFLLMPIIFNPESTLSVGLSLFPLFAPITMFVRILVSEPPFWHIALSIVLSIGMIWLLLWTTAKIFRVGILSYGKRPTIPELWKWLKVA